MQEWLDYSEEVLAAKKRSAAASQVVSQGASQAAPVVALESTIISHGLPYPQNAELALELEDIVRKAGATPATIAVMDGRLKVGLTQGEIERLATPRDSQEPILKLSRRDLAFALSQKKLGATTVSATMLIASLAGIRVFATGGIGGVHRGAMETFDISADLTELARTKVAVVCAGAKSILDLGLTLEYLETQGVPVLGYQTLSLPAFYSRTSPFQCNFKLDQVEAVAEFLRTHWELPLSGGVVIANPIPEKDSVDSVWMEAQIAKGIAEAKHQKIQGKEVTPFLLKYLVTASGGITLRANLALVRNNARLASELALAL